MKIQISILLFSITAIATFAQGKISYGNTSAHMAVFNQTYMLPADVAYDGQPIPTTTLPSGITMNAALYAGMTSGSLALQTAFPLTGANMVSPGVWTPNSLVMASIPGGSPVYFQFFVWGTFAGFGLPGTISSTSDFQISVNAFYFGTSGLFTAVPGASIAYPQITNPNPPTSSTLLPGDITIFGAPEPSSLALCGLATAALCLFRRRDRC